jgi:hypothetical protein
MRVFGAFVVIALAAAGCGDNIIPKSERYSERGGFSSLSGAQISHSKSFMLVSSVSSAHEQENGIHKLGGAK